MIKKQTWCIHETLVCVVVSPSIDQVPNMIASGLLQEWNQNYQSVIPGEVGEHIRGPNEVKYPLSLRSIRGIKKVIKVLKTGHSYAKWGLQFSNAKWY